MSIYDRRHADPKRPDRSDLWATLILYVMIVVIMAAVFLAAQTEARADESSVDISVGCVENGVPGMAMFDGSCMTAAEYDETFSVEALSEVPWSGPADVSVAEAYGLTDAAIRPQDRPRSFGGVPMPTWGEVLHTLHSGRPLY